ncbi:PAS domain S-box-containing protein [Methylobacterium sp. 174MFSha1.1]|uniref:HWE histidine kinase domain-containing protein n=1 Tax=Methylobacterium sp. 174MFSha1.1 TaxID=1502749 RepID=UPI0008E4A0E6|nr:HWE histidine kinase domain-containing protein [Methylobacterium sp. 174MFSha1.1]SFV06964.1 PAS domain S-box-containing protein [Methylobacterium sp. 174MFSha1.1]
MSRSGGNGPVRIDLRLLQAAVEATGEAILITTAELDEPGPVIVYANPAFTKLSGYDAAEAVGRSPCFLQGDGTDRVALDRTRASLEAGEAFQGEALNYRKDGTAYRVEWLITPVRNTDGRITNWVSAQRDVTERRAFEDRQALMVRELHHRVKNTLATVQAVLNATMRSSVTMAEFSKAFGGRIVSLARTHALITEDEAQVASFEGLLRAELDPYDEDGRVTLDGPRLKLPSEVAVPVSMALHELTTNALRHGALGHPGGRVVVTWRIGDGPAGPWLTWTWNEHDGPPPTLPTREGFGTRLLNKILTAQVAAEVDVAFERDGLRVRVRLPLERR